MQSHVQITWVSKGAWAFLDWTRKHRHTINNDNEHVVLSHYCSRALLFTNPASRTAIQPGLKRRFLAIGCVQGRHITQRTRAAIETLPL